MTKGCGMQVFIQNEAGSDQKNYHDEKTLVWERRVEVSRRYPYPYGFVIGTTGEDGYNVDCFVLTTDRLRSDELVECKVVGLMEQVEDGEADHNVLAVPVGQDFQVDSAVQGKLSEFVSHVFDHIEGKEIRVGRFLPAEEAQPYIDLHRDDDGILARSLL